MTSRYEVTLNGVSLESLHPAIYIIDVAYAAPDYQIETYPIVKRQGARVSRMYKEKAEVSIRFTVRAYETVERQSILHSIVMWARNGGDLRINDRPGQKLICVCEQMPGVESVRGWTDELTVTFAAYVVPYWQSLEETVATLHLDAGTQMPDTDATFTGFDLYVPGNAPCSYMSMKYTVDTATTSYNLHFELLNNSRNDGNFIIEGGYSTGEVQYKTLEYDSEFIPNLYTYEYLAQPTQRYVKNNQLHYLKGIDDIIVSCGETNHLLIRYGGLDTTNSTFLPRECDIEFRTRGLWE